MIGVVFIPHINLCLPFTKAAKRFVRMMCDGQVFLNVKRIWKLNWLKILTTKLHSYLVLFFFSSCLAFITGWINLNEKKHPNTAVCVAIPAHFPIEWCEQPLYSLHFLGKHRDKGLTPGSIIKGRLIFSTNGENISHSLYYCHVLLLSQLNNVYRFIFAFSYIHGVFNFPSVFMSSLQ